MAKINWREVKKYPLSAHKLEGKDNIKNYCMGGNAIVTLTSPTTVHYSYYIRSPWMEDKDDFKKDVRFVYVMNSLNRWMYLGELCNDGKYFRVTKNSQYRTDSPEFKGMQYIVKMMNKEFNTHMILQHEGCCSRCGRRLVDPISIERGIGPKCFSIMYGSKISKQQQELEDKELLRSIDVPADDFEEPYWEAFEGDQLSIMK